MDNLLPPHSDEAEEALLGSVFISPFIFYDAASVLEPHDFFILRNGWVWEAMKRLHDRSEYIDIITVGNELQAQGRLEEIGGSSRLTFLTQRVGTSLEANTYAHIVKRASIRRAALDAASKITDIALDENLDIYEVEAAIRSEVEKPFNGVALRKSRNMAEITDAASDYIFQEDVEGVRFYLKDVDEVIGDMIPGDYMVVSARTGIGKSRLLFQTALRNAQHGKNCLILTTEMSEEEVIWVLIEMMSTTGIQVRDIRNRSIRKNEKQVKEFLELNAHVATLPLTIERVDGFTVEQVAAIVLRFPPRAFDAVFMDYSQRLKPSPGYDRKRSDQEIGNRARTMRRLAQSQETVIFDAAQFNRENAGKNQGTENVRGSDEIAHEAVFLIGIERDLDPASDKQNQAMIRFQKGRFIRGGQSVITYFHPVKGTYENAEITTINLDAI